MRKISLLTASGMMAAAALAYSTMAHAAGHADYEAALKSLHQAEDDLNKAGDDPSGHKAKALEHVHQAIGEAEAAGADSQERKQATLRRIFPAMQE